MGFLCEQVGGFQLSALKINYQRDVIHFHSWQDLRTLGHIKIRLELIQDSNQMGRELEILSCVRIGCRIWWSLGRGRGGGGSAMLGAGEKDYSPLYGCQGAEGRDIVQPQGSWGQGVEFRTSGRKRQGGGFSFNPRKNFLEPEPFRK